MVYQYYVVVDPNGRVGLATTKRAAIGPTESPNGAQIFCVEANNAFSARRRAADLWRTNGKSPDLLH